MPDKPSLLRMQDLLIEMQNAEAHSLDYLALASVLVAGAKSGEDAIRLTALRWLRVIIADAKAQLLPLYAPIVQAILPALSSTFPDILEVLLFLFSPSRVVVASRGSASLESHYALDGCLHVVRILQPDLPVYFHLAHTSGGATDRQQLDTRAVSL